MLDIQQIAIERINPASYNPRKDLQPSDPAYSRLKKALERFDLVEPLVWNKRSGNLVGGHQRLKILKERGDAVVPVSVVRFGTSSPLTPTSLVITTPPKSRSSACAARS